MFRQPDGDTNFFYIVASVLQVNTSALNMFIICLDYVLRTLKENYITLKEDKTQTISCGNCHIQFIQMIYHQSQIHLPKPIPYRTV